MIISFVYVERVVGFFVGIKCFFFFLMKKGRRIFVFYIGRSKVKKGLESVRFGYRIMVFFIYIFFSNSNIIL